MSSETSTNDVTAVEPGWAAKTDDDHKTGTIKEVTDRYFLYRQAAEVPVE